MRLQSVRKCSGASHPDLETDPTASLKISRRTFAAGIDQAIDRIVTAYDNKRGRQDG